MFVFFLQIKNFSIAFRVKAKALREWFSIVALYDFR
jgi:hypothetical protein